MPAPTRKDSPHGAEEGRPTGRARARTLGVDLGRVRCGIAIDDELGRLAHPRPNLPARDRRLLVEALTHLAENESVGRFVLGMPFELSGREGRAAERVRMFAQHLADASGLDVVLWDERMTTVEAERALRAGGLDARDSREVVDGAAATMILQSFLDARRAARRRSSEG